MEFVITTITCNNRNTLQLMIKSFMENTIFSKKYKWVILMQGNSNEYLDNFKIFLKQYENIEFELIILNENIGLSKGMNILNNFVSDYVYVLHLEDDWICLPYSTTNCDKNWLDTCLQFLNKNPSVATLFLRKYIDEDEKFRYGWTRTIPYYAHKNRDNFNYRDKMINSDIQYLNNIKFQHIPKFLFTFNPTIRRNYIYYDKVFPLIEFEDVSRQKMHEDSDKWGWCEALTMEKTIDMVTYNVACGIFGHYDDWYNKLK